MPGEGQFVQPTQIEVTSDIGADVADDATLPPFPPATGLTILGLETATGLLRVPRVNAAGQWIVSIGPTTPGATITTPADVAVGIGATVPLPAIPVGTTRMTVQVTGPAGSFVRVREVAAGAGRGIILARLGSITYGGEAGAIAALEVEDVSLAVGGVAVATSVAIQFEGP